MFDKKFFKKRQKLLLFLLNTPLIKIWFRFVMRIDQKQQIDRIDPNGFFWKKENNKIGFDIRVHNKYSKRLYYGFYYIWALFHFLDMNFINNFQPKWNLGFDSFDPIYPDVGSGVTACDGVVRRSGVYDFGFPAIRTGLGTSASDTATLAGVQVSHYSTNLFQNLSRLIFNFDTSSIGGDVNSATLSLYGAYKDGLDGTPNTDIVSCSPASTGTLVASDYNYLNFGTDVFGSITWAGHSSTSYNDVTLDTAGIGNIDISGISSFGARHSWDVSGVYGGVGGNRYTIMGYWLSDNAGVTKDPKLSGEFSSGGVTANAIFFSHNF